jgi:D-alanyl-D-alanine carboxypeptidase (penicillin-binding protein 5/6)
MQAGPRRRRRLPPVSPLRAALGLVLVAVLLAAGLVVWWVLPLTDRGQGVISQSSLTGVVPQTPSSGSGVTRPLSAVGESTKPIPGVRVASGIVIDAGSGRVLWSRHPHTRRPIASLTKLMTALLADRPGTLGKRFLVTPAMTGEAGYTIGLRGGRRVSVRDMLAAMLIASANDAADALAVHRSGSISRFVALMNRQARRMKLSDTRYSNPSGIIDAGNASSAWDVADLTRYVLARPALRRLVASKVYQPAQGAPYVNRNQLLWTYPDADGVKTGQTTLAGNCLVAAARRHGHTVIAVELGAGTDQFQVAARMLDWGFRRVRR